MSLDLEYDDLVIIDIEASGFGPDSYPIEIAYSNFNGSFSDSFLINPETAVGWDHWDTSSEAVHGIRKEDLISKGVSVDEAVKRLNNALCGYHALSDNVYFDQDWMTALFNSTPEKPHFSMLSLQDELGINIPLDLDRKHRALDDVKQLIQVIKQHQSAKKSRAGYGE